tara:strand:- start:3699 stop:3992 length:294 start_codon:yes stop_codon:yes gene_type:complete
MTNIGKKTKAKIKMIEMGIVPALTGTELRNMLSSLTKEERRTAKRKFRKIWRKIAKSNSQYSYLVDKKARGEIPDEYTLKNRARIVTASIVNKIDSD